MTKPDLSPGEKPEPKEIRDFREQYAAALQHAHVSEEHTGGPGPGTGNFLLTRTRRVGKLFPSDL